MNYEEKVTVRADVRALYEKVIANPAIERYRGYTAARSYGWDPVAKDYIKAEGEVWFENPAYVPDADGALTDGDEILADGVENTPETPDRAELCAIIDALNAQIGEAEAARAANDEALTRAESKLGELRAAFETIRRFITEE